MNSEENYFRNIGLLIASLVVIGLGFEAIIRIDIVWQWGFGILITLLWSASLLFFLYTITYRESFEKAEVISSGLLLAAIIFSSLVYMSSPAPASDLTLFSEYASQELIEGENPYDISMAPSFRQYNGTILWTPQRDGTIYDKFTYPGLSIIAYVPTTLIDVDSRYLGLLLTSVLFISIFLYTPERLGVLSVAVLGIVPLQLLSIFLENDILWILPLTLSVMAWDRHKDVSALLFGLAISAKQIPWLIAPFIFLKLLLGDEERRTGLQKGLRYSGIAGIVFLAFNLPFIALDPTSWFNNVLGHVLLSVGGEAPQAFIGQGMAFLSFSGFLEVEKWFYTAAAVSAYILYGIIFIKGSTEFRDTLWILPAIVLFFNYRGLIRYYIGFVPIALAVLIHQYRRKNDIRGLRDVYPVFED